VKSDSIIQSHDVTLYGGNDHDIILRPLCDDHLPLLYKWNADPEVLYWTEGGPDIKRSYDAETVHKIYGGPRDRVMYFLVEVDGVPIGECWLQRMNVQEILDLYPGKDVRRIDMMIGEKAYWGKGLGTAFVNMLIDYAFYGEGVDVMHCFAEDYNVRSCKLWERLGFTQAYAFELPPGQKGSIQYHFALTRETFRQRRRTHISAEQRFEMAISDLQPCQLCISAGKLQMVQEWFDPANKTIFDPIPIKRLNGRVIMVDGHSRAVAAFLQGWDTIPVYWDTDPLDMRAYAMDVQWCDEEGIHGIADLAQRIVPHKEYEVLWRKRCMEMVLT